MRGKRILLMSALSAGTLIAGSVGVAAPAFANFGDTPGYAGVATLVQGEVAQRPLAVQEPAAAPATAAQTTNQALPVTGGDVAELAGFGFVLLASGTVLVRRTRRRA